MQSTWVKALKDKKKVKTVYNGFNEIVNESSGKPFWVDQRRQFYNKLMQEWLDDNDVLINSTHIEDKSLITENSNSNR